MIFCLVGQKKAGIYFQQNCQGAIFNCDIEGGVNTFLQSGAAFCGEEDVYITPAVTVSVGYKV